MNRKKLIATITSLTIMTSVFTGCNGNKNSQKEDTLVNSAEESGSLLLETTGVSLEDMFTPRDIEVGYSNTDFSEINLSDDSITTTSEAVSIDNNTITISDEGTYIISGSLSNGQIIIDAESTDKIQLVLKGTSINCDTSAPIYVRQADKVFITLEQDTENTLSNKSEFIAIDENNIDAVIFSKDDLTLNGLGTLNINGAYGHGIVSKDDLVITSGTYNITAAGHGLQGKDSLRIAEGNITINSGKDGLHSENIDDESLGFIYIASGNFNINSTNDGLDGGSIVQVDGGTFNLTTGGGSANSSTDDHGNIREDWGQWNNGTAPNGNFDPNAVPPTSDGSQKRPGFSADNSNTDASTSASQMTPSSTAPNKDSTDGSTTMPSDDSTAGPTLPTPGHNSGNGADMPMTTPGNSNGMENNDTTVSPVEDTTASAKALKADGPIVLNSGTFTIDSSDDSIHSNYKVYINDGTYSMSSGDDGIHGDSEVKINGGSISITKSYEGVEGQSIEITGGTLDLVASDDGLNAAGGNDSSALNGRPGQNNFNSSSDSFIKISGGVLNINANGDGIDSNGALYISGGETYVAGPSNNGNGALDFDSTGEITGGVIIATGASGMALNFGNTSTQGSILYNSSTTQSQLVSISDSNGKVLASFTPDKEYNSVVISTPEIKSGETYTLNLGTETQTIEMTSLIYGNSSGMGGGMGSHGGKGFGENKGTMPPGTDGSTSQP